MKVVYADDHDARLAAAAIYRLGSIAATKSTRPSSSSNMQLDLDRRYDQLIECIELRIRSIKVADLSRYLWAAITLRVIEEEQANLALNEYIRRLSSDDESCAITIEEGAAILWAVGCLKDTYGWTSTKLISLLCEHLDEGELSELPTKLILRVLWSLAVHNCYDIDICKISLDIIDKREFDNVTGTNAINLLWSIAKFGDLVEYDILLRLLGRIFDIICDKKHHLGISEIGMAADALVLLYEISKKSEIAIISSCDSKTQEDITSVEFQNLSSIGKILLSVEKVINILMDRFIFSYGSLSNLKSSSISLSVSFIISILRAAINATSQVQDIWDFALIQLQNMINNSDPISVVEAANLLEIIAFVPRIEILDTSVRSSVENNNSINTTMTENNSMIHLSSTLVPVFSDVTSSASPLPSASTSSSSFTSSSVSSSFTSSSSSTSLSNTASAASINTSSTLLDSLNFQIKKKKLSGVTRQPEWHSVAGKLAAITATNSGQIKDKTCLINACWSIALLGYPYRKLLTIVRKSIQFALHEISPNLLSRLVVAVAAEECLIGVIVSSGTSGLSASPKLDREFVDQVALSVYYNLADITPLSDQISAMFAVACLGRLTSFEMRPNSVSPPMFPMHGVDKKNEERRPVNFSKLQLISLSTSELIRLLWAMHRLPVGVVDYNTMEAVRIEIGSRNLIPQDISPTSTEDEVTKDDLKLYVRVLSEITIPSDVSKPDGSVASACNALLSQLQSSVLQVDVENDMTSIQESFILSQLVIEAASLSDALQSYIDLNWHLPEAIEYFEKQCTLLSKKHALFPLSEKLCASSYHIGRLEQSIKIFKSSPPTTKTNDFRYDIGKRLSRWLGIL